MHIGKHFSSVKRFNFLVTLSIIAILVSTLLISLGRIQNQIETVKLNSELMNMRLQLRDAWGHRSVLEQTGLSKTKSAINPFMLLKPYPDYIGEYAIKPDDTQSVWYFDTTKKQAVYILKNGDEQRYKLVNSVEILLVE